MTLKTFFLIISPLVGNDRSRRFPILTVEPVVGNQLLRHLIAFLFVAYELS
jgi:hypothetical protein